MSKEIVKPKDENEYKKWLFEFHGIEITNKTQIYYDSVTSKIVKDLKDSDFWKQLTSNLKEFDDTYINEKGYDLLATVVEPELFIKPFDSFLTKTYRKNILENRYFPEPPNGGWILPENWFARINDIVRTLFVVKYLDGVDFLITKIQGLCNTCSLKSNSFFEARKEGYYAAHFYLHRKFEIPNQNWDTQTIDFTIEFQITTQLQEVIRKLLHTYYEKRRIKLKPFDDSWMWDYASEEFATNYLGHMLHYIEGMIVDIRERQKK